MIMKEQISKFYFVINKRLLASTIDMLIYLYLIRYILFFIRFNILEYPLNQDLWSCLDYTLCCLYFLLKDFVFRNASIGKRILGLKVVMKDGTKVKWYILILRNIFYYPVLMFFDFLLIVLFNTRICDLILKTTVCETNNSK